MPPLPKPPERAHRKQKPKALATVTPMRSRAPKAPDGLSAALKTEWQAFWASHQGSLVTEGMRPSVVRLFRLRQQQEEALAVLESGDQLTRGSTGQWRLNPAADYVLKLETAILRLESEFGLTLKAAARLMIDLGGAKRSLDDLNRGADLGEQAIDETDPRLGVAGSEVVESAQDP